jgi:hypothetical protein
MRNRIVGAVIVVATTALIGVTIRPSAGQAPAAGGYKGPRTSDGKPNLNGVWQTLSTANWDLQAHAAAHSPVVALGAVGAVPPGPGVVEGNEIPYKPEALAKKKENAANWLTLDPEIKCYLPGVPRATYLPHPFQIIQNPQGILIAYQFGDAHRFIPVTTRTEDAPIDSWMGDSVAKWEGDTLVVDAKSFNDQTWFDRAGNYHSDALHVIERYTPIDANTINYEATIEDPNVFTRPWKISLPLHRHIGKSAQLMEFKCVEFAEELMYGHLRKPGAER